MAIFGRSRLILTFAAIAATGTMTAAKAASPPSPAVIGPVTASGAAMTAVLPPIACQTAASQVAAAVYGQAPVRNAVLPVVGQINTACAQGSATAASALDQAGSASAPAAAANPAVNPALDLGAAAVTAAAAQLPAGVNPLGPGPADLAPAITYLKGS